VNSTYLITIKVEIKSLSDIFLAFNFTMHASYGAKERTSLIFTNNSICKLLYHKSEFFFRSEKLYYHAVNFYLIAWK